MTRNKRLANPSIWLASWSFSVTSWTLKNAFVRLLIDRTQHSKQCMKTSSACHTEKVLHVHHAKCMTSLISNYSLLLPTWLLPRIVWCVDLWQADGVLFPVTRCSKWRIGNAIILLVTDDGPQSRRPMKTTRVDCRSTTTSNYSVTTTTKIQRLRPMRRDTNYHSWVIVGWKM